jgi:hypothetical protein
MPWPHPCQIDKNLAAEIEHFFVSRKQFKSLGRYGTDRAKRGHGGPGSNGGTDRGGGTLPVDAERLDRRNAWDMVIDLFVGIF